MPAPLVVRSAGLCAAIAASHLAGCALPVSDACVSYVECQEAVDESVDTTAYKEDGSCWANPQTAAACDAQCKEALDALRETPDAPEACQR